MPYSFLVNFMRLQNKFINIAAVVLLVLILGNCAQEQSSPLSIGVSVWPGFECLYLARDLGYYKNTSIRLVDYRANSELIRAFRNGDLEAAAMTIPEAFSLATAESNLQFVLAMDVSNGGDAVVAKPHIPNLQALKGQRLGVDSSSALGPYMLIQALEQADLSFKDVKIISIGISEHERAFKKGTVDAVITFEPIRSSLLAAGARLLFDSSKIPGEIVDVIVVRGNLLTSQSANLQALVDGWFRALAYLKNNPQDAARRIAPREGITPHQFLESLKGVRLLSLQENKNLLGKTDTTLLNGIKRLSQKLVENNLSKQELDPISMLNDQLVKNVK